MSTYFEFAEPSSQDITSQDSSVPGQHKPMDISEDNEYYEDEVEDSAILEDEGEEEDAWDDSALIAAWDIAMKQYQDFHSIKANKTDTKGSKAIPTSSSNKVIVTEESVNVAKEDKIEDLIQDDLSKFDKNEGASTSSIIMKTTVKEQKQTIQKPSEQKIKETGQIKSQTAIGSTSVLTSGQDTSYKSQPMRTTATYPSYSHNFPGYYSYPSPSATSSTAPIPPHSFGEQFKGTIDTQEDQGESQPPSTEEVHSNTNAHDSYFNGERYSSAAYGWYSNYYPPPPPPPPVPGPQPPPQFYPSMHNNPNHPFSGWKPKSQDMAPPMTGFDDDEALTNLIMAWYYSGYYTGLYHGRKGR
ncbi:hypothetical protein RclHR1_01170005 [Rhizophagus clarus]|uniref:Survival Motor Neuron Gemin2-binding domain-containing protein n=1 Tax=Rhizophagus clarus TaxID=94130 RepID=A0A2Z6QK58_9GLOM|nr:hypothetical protein RclHR1_01170005 [Rhizophagus clarus]GES78378.1 hypothetical protein GLOIN_2v1621704 [Rhizophagus clarus]